MAVISAIFNYIYFVIIEVNYAKREKDFIMRYRKYCCI